MAQKKWVICDRFSASSVAFQGGGRGISVSDVYWLNQFATQNLKPDLTVLLDLSVEVSKARQKKRQQETGQGADRIESENDLFHNKVRESFLDQAKNDPDHWLVLSAIKTPAELENELVTELRRRQWLS